MDLKWTEVLSAVSAASSALLALVAALVAYRGVRVAWKNYQVQQRQLGVVLEEQRRWSAARFCAWIDYDDDSCILKYHNAGDLPVFDVVVWYSLDDPVRWSNLPQYFPRCTASPDERAGLLGDFELYTVGPTASPCEKEGSSEVIGSGVKYVIDYANDREKLTSDVLFELPVSEGFKNIALRAHFTDAEGTRWERDGAVLHRLEQGKE